MFLQARSLRKAVQIFLIKRVRILHNFFFARNEEAHYKNFTITPSLTVRSVRRVIFVVSLLKQSL